MSVKSEESAAKNKGDLELGGTSAPDEFNRRFGESRQYRFNSMISPEQASHFDLIEYFEKFKNDVGAHDIDINEFLKPPQDMLAVLKEIKPDVYKDVADMDEFHKMYYDDIFIGEDNIRVPSGLRAFVENKIAKSDENNTLLVSYIPRNKRDSQSLRKYFEPYGDVTAADVAIDPKTKRSKDYGFVDFLKQGQARLAINKLNPYGMRGEDYLEQGQARLAINKLNHRYGMEGRGEDYLKVEWAAISCRAWSAISGRARR